MQGAPSVPGIVDHVTNPGSPSWCASIGKTVDLDRKRIAWSSGRATVRLWWSPQPIEVDDGDVIYTFPTPYGPAVDEVVKREALEGRDAEVTIEFELQGD